MSLKQSLVAQGFKGGSRGDTEWNQWVSAEKSALAFVMERYGVEWEHKGIREKHLSVLDYKKQERTRKVEKLGSKIEEKQAGFEAISERVKNYDEGVKGLSDLETAPEYTLPESQRLRSAKTYRHKIVDPFMKKLKVLIKIVLARCFEGGTITIV